MTMQPLLGRSEIRRRRHGRPRRTNSHGSASRGTVRELVDASPSQDTALYNCHCGFVFEAPVLTSVDCPHCGYGQVW